MIYHLLHVSTYPAKYLRFLIKNRSIFDLNKHHFIIETNDKPLFEKDILDNINYTVTRKGWDIFKALRNVKDDDKIIVHYLGNPRHLLLFAFVPKLTRRIIWSIWGGDAYFHQYLNDSWKFRFYEILRKLVIPEIPWITCVVEGDYDVIMKNYPCKAHYVYSVYPSDINDPLFMGVATKCSSSSKNIVVVGNSADPSNNHEEILTSLIPYKPQIDEILVPLMYGGGKDYVKRVIKFGQQLFGNKFKPLTTFMPSSEYIKILCSASVQIVNHNRQQGLGNLFVMLALRKKVYVRSNTSSYAYLRMRGILVHDTIDLINGNETDLFAFDAETASMNATRMQDEVSESNLVGRWNQVFELQ